MSLVELGRDLGSHTLEAEDGWTYYLLRLYRIGPKRFHNTDVSRGNRRGDLSIGSSTVKLFPLLFILPLNSISLVPLPLLLLMSKEEQNADVVERFQGTGQHERGPVQVMFDKHASNNGTEARGRGLDYVQRPHDRRPFLR